MFLLQVQQPPTPRKGRREELKTLLSERAVTSCDRASLLDPLFGHFLILLTTKRLLILKDYLKKTTNQQTKTTSRTDLAGVLLQ